MIYKDDLQGFTRREAHFSIYKPGKGGVCNQLEEEDKSGE